MASNPWARRDRGHRVSYSRRSAVFVRVGAPGAVVAASGWVGSSRCLLDDPAFFAPFVPYFDPRIGRPSTPVETYLRLMFLKFWYRLGYESLCREVADSITWRRFCRIPLEGAVPHPTTLMKLSTRCGAAAVEGLNEALLAKAAEAKLLRTNRIRVDTTVVPGNVAYPTDSGLLAKAVRRIAVAGRRIQAAGGATRTKIRDRSRAAGKRGSPDRQGPAGQARRVRSQGPGGRQRRWRGLGAHRRTGQLRRRAPARARGRAGHQAHRPHATHRDRRPRLRREEGRRRPSTTSGSSTW